MADFLSKLKSNIGEHAEDTSYNVKRQCFANGGAVGNPSRLKGDGSLRQHGGSNVSLQSLKNIWSTSGEVPRFAKGGKVTCIEIDGGTMCAPDDGAIEIDGGFMIPADKQTNKHTRKNKKLHDILAKISGRDEGDDVEDEDDDVVEDDGEDDNEDGIYIDDFKLQQLPHKSHTSTVILKRLPDEKLSRTLDDQVPHLFDA